MAARWSARRSSIVAPATAADSITALYPRHCRLGSALDVPPWRRRRSRGSAGWRPAWTDRPSCVQEAVDPRPTLPEDDRGPRIRAERPYPGNGQPDRGVAAARPVLRNGDTDAVGDLVAVRVESAGIARNALPGLPDGRRGGRPDADADDDAGVEELAVVDDEVLEEHAEASSATVATRPGTTRTEAGRRMSCPERGGTVGEGPAPEGVAVTVTLVRCHRDSAPHEGRSNSCGEEGGRPDAVRLPLACASLGACEPHLLERVALGLDDSQPIAQDAHPLEVRGVLGEVGVKVDLLRPEARRRRGPRLRPRARPRHRAAAGTRRRRRATDAADRRRAARGPRRTRAR